MSNGTAAPKRDPDLASSSPASVASDSKGKQVATQPLADVVVPLPMSWPRAYPVGPGYHNLGNTCFLNSTLQALTHTAPLVSCLVGDTYHSSDQCRVLAEAKRLHGLIPYTGPLARNRRLCVLCQMQKHVRSCFTSNKRQYGAIRPDAIVGSLNCESGACPAASQPTETSVGSLVRLQLSPNICESVVRRMHTSSCASSSTRCKIALLRA